MGWSWSRHTTAVLVLGLSLLDSTSCRAQEQQQQQQQQQAECSQLEYGRCIRMADPLLRDPDYVFPDNVRDIGRVCGIWEQFVSCVQLYTQRCFSESRQVAFDKAVQDTKESMRQMCHVTQYQTEYLKHAGCMKSMLTREENCGKHYQHLVRQVYGEVTRPALCCSLHLFRECMIAEVRAECDQGSGDGHASRFTRHTLDKALSFLREQCYNYVPSSGECAGLGLTPTGRADDARGTTPGQQHHGDVAPLTPPGEDRRASYGPQAGGGAQAASSGSSAPRPWSATEGSRAATTDRDSAWTSSSRGIPNLSEGTDDFSPWYPRQTDTAAGSSHHSPSVSHPGATTPLSSPEYSTSRASTFGRGLMWTPSTSSWPSGMGSSWTPPSSTWTPPSGSWTPPSSSWAPPSGAWTPPSGRSWTPPSSSWTPPSSSWTPPTSTWAPPTMSSWAPPGDPWTPSSKPWRPSGRTTLEEPWTPSPANTWRMSSGGSSAPSYPYSTEAWYPGAGNTVDEPNQQGLTVGGAPGSRALGLVMLAALAVFVSMLC